MEGDFQIPRRLPTPTISGVMQPHPELEMGIVKNQSILKARATWSRVELKPVISDPHSLQALTPVASSDGPGWRYITGDDDISP